MNRIEERILQCEKKLMQAMKRGDVPLLDELLHPALLFTIANGQTITKEIDLESLSFGEYGGGACRSE